MSQTADSAPITRGPAGGGFAVRDRGPGQVRATAALERTITNDGYLGDMEDTVVVTANGAEKITNAPMRHW